MNKLYKEIKYVYIVYTDKKIIDITLFPLLAKYIANGRKAKVKRLNVEEAILES